MAHIWITEFSTGTWESHYIIFFSITEKCKRGEKWVPQEKKGIQKHNSSKSGKH